MISLVSNSKAMVSACFFFLLCAQLVDADPQVIHTYQKENLSEVWPSSWIQSADGPSKAYSVHYFRKTFELDAIPPQLIVHTSGDNRYQLYVNGNRVTIGPQRGDLRHWFYESTDISPFLKRGKNVVAAVVLNYGGRPPDAQLSVQTGFLLASDDRAFRYLNTDSGWKAIHDKGYSPNIVDRNQVAGYYGGGSREILDGRLSPWEWETVDYNDSNWPDAIVVERAFAKECKWASRWKLTPRTLRHERQTPGRFESVRMREELEIPASFPEQATDIRIPANRHARIVLDWGHVTTAYTKLKVSGGCNTVMTLTYVEAPHVGDVKKRQKGDRNEVSGKTFMGYFDRFIADGGDNRTYEPLWWRTFRYLYLEIETRDEPLILHDVSAVHSSYPFTQRASIETEGSSGDVDNDVVQEMLKIGHRTMIANSHEHFMDCPYYEESQFPGDTRIEALVSYMNYGDPALGRNAIDQFSWSINDEGFISARYPTNSLYYIPNYSLYWIGMLHDFMMYKGDRQFIASKLPVMRMILGYFENKERPDGTLYPLDYHQFVDWSFPSGEATTGPDGRSSISDMHYLMALQWAADLETWAGDPEVASIHRQKIIVLTDAIRSHYWNEELGLFMDHTASEPAISQHANALAILTDVATKDDHRNIMGQVLSESTMTQATLYWSFYVFEALHKADMGAQYLDNLDVWTELMDLGATTWPESGPNSRSECHGWGASPNYHFLKIVAGMQPASPGFEDIVVEPNFGNLTRITAQMPHPQGMVEMDINRSSNNLSGWVRLPDNINGTFSWQGIEMELKPGKNDIN
ncbi:MAG: alpha-L-rhamnosidase C-terminal domain-containing protein [Puniceicoccaceae bacterium]